MTAAQTYRALLRSELEHRQPTAAERAGMQSEIERLKHRKSARERLLRERYRKAMNGK